MSITAQAITRCAMVLTMQQMVNEVRDGLQGKLHVRGRSLDAQIRKAGRRLPRRVRQDATYLAQGVALMENPKLARMIDIGKAASASQCDGAFEQH